MGPRRQQTRTFTRRAATTTLLAGAAAGCGGGFFEDDEGVTLTSAPSPALPVSPAPPASAQAGMLNRNGLQLTFSEEFGSLAQDYSKTLPLNGKWQTWLNNGGRDNFYSRTLHQNKGEEQQYYVDQYILDKHCAHVPGYRKYDPFSLVDGPDGKKVLRITARRMEQAMVNALRDKLGTAQGLTTYQATKFWSSGTLSTFEGFKQRYGVFEARIKMSPHAGSWPAFWMLAADRGWSYWPPEIDIVDNFPQRDAQDRWILGGVVTKTPTGFGPSDGGINGKVMPYKVRDAWHTFAAEWTDKTIAYYANDVEVFRTATPANFHENMFMMLNLAVVGQDNTWADKPLSHVAELALDIAWVRVWKRV